MFINMSANIGANGEPIATPSTCTNNLPLNINTLSLIPQLRALSKFKQSNNDDE